MMRILLLMAIAVLIAVAFTSLHAALTPRRRAPSAYPAKEKFMPSALKNISYGLLLALMFGIVTGWIGG